MSLKRKLIAISFISVFFALVISDLIISSIGRSNGSNSPYLGAMLAWPGIFIIGYSILWIGLSSLLKIQNWANIFKKTVGWKVIAGLMAIPLGGMLFQYFGELSYLAGILIGFTLADFFKSEHTVKSSKIDYLSITLFLALGFCLTLLGTPLYRFIF